MYRYALLDADGRLIQIVRAAHAGDATLYGFREVKGFDKAESEEAYNAMHDRLTDSFRKRYLVEGHDADKAQAMAEVAAGPRPRPRKAAVVEVPEQKPLPTSRERASRQKSVKELAAERVVQGSTPGTPRRVHGPVSTGLFGRGRR